MQDCKQSGMRKASRASALLIAIVASLVTISGVAAEENGSQGSIAQRLQAVEDRLDIQQLVTSDYSTAVDTRDLNALADLFTEDGEFTLLATQFPPKHFKGRAAIEQALAPPPPGVAPPNAGGPPGGMPVSQKHVITNTQIQLDGDDATATSYWMEVAIGKDEKVNVMSTGYYSDVLKRDGRRWRFKSRTVYDYDRAPVAKPESR
jgi:3-phenylpropionate/cinnamic acid dioxygenase small subunit